MNYKTYTDVFINNKQYNIIIIYEYYIMKVFQGTLFIQIRLYKKYTSVILIEAMRQSDTD